MIWKTNLFKSPYKLNKKSPYPKKYRPKSGYANSYGRLWWKKPSTTITRNFGTPSSARCVHPLIDRALTTREGARLQSFPDWFQFYGSRAKKNLQIGNAVPPLLANKIAKSVLPDAVGPIRDITLSILFFSNVISQVKQVNFIYTFN